MFVPILDVPDVELHEIDAFVRLVCGVALAPVLLPLAVKLGRFFLVAVVMTWLTRRVYHVAHVNARTQLDPPFDGLRLSKRGTRQESHSAAIRMLRTNEESVSEPTPGRLERVDTDSESESRP